MSSDIINIKYKSEPVLLDKVIQDIQVALKNNLSWLDFAFGRAYRLVQSTSEGEKFIYPAVYNGNGEYLSVMPNDDFGNFCWFDIYDPQDITTVTQSRPQFTFEGAIVFWYKLDTIYDDNSVLHTEEIKNEILSLLTTPGLITTISKFTVNRVYERFENIYKGYMIEKVYNDYAYKNLSIQNIDRQFFMYPYAGLRVEFKLITREICQRYIK